MDTIYFKTATGAAANSFDCAKKTIFYQQDQTQYINLAGARKTEIHGNYKGWNLVLGMLTSAQMDYLEALLGYETPQFSENGSDYYAINVISISIELVGSTVSVLKQAKET